MIGQLAARLLLVAVTTTIPSSVPSVLSSSTVTTTTTAGTTTTVPTSTTTTATSSSTTLPNVGTTASVPAPKRVSPHRRPRVSPVELRGTFELTGGTCAAGAVGGTYFRMLQPGSAPDGPKSLYLSNTDSSCANKTYTPLEPGSDGGLIAGDYQPEPAPAFAANGSALAERIVKPAVFFGVQFSVATAPIDPQTGVAVPAPALRATNGQLGGDLRAFEASWNRGHFNQGSPKPNGATPGLTAGPAGTYDAATGAYTLDWTSLIVGGPFDGFSGQWHLTGRFVAAGATDPGTGVSAGAPTTAAASVAPADLSSTDDDGSSPLANTGANTSALAVIGAWLVVLGAGLASLERSRRNRSPQA